MEDRKSIGPHGKGENMERIIWCIIMVPISLLMTGIGVYALKREKPMWFWSGTTVKEEEISDVKAYNRANGIMWLVFSCVFWISTVLGFFKSSVAGLALIIGCFIGIPGLVIAYLRIYNRYKK